MNQIQGYADVHQPHLSANSGHSASSGPPHSISHYQYHQPPVLQSGPQSYPTPQSSYGQYSYGNGVSPSSSTGHPVSSSIGHGLVPQSLSLPTMPSGGPGAGAAPGSQGYGQHVPYDTSGQVAPPGMKPRVTATLWEDEGSLCFQVEAKGVCVARREDNHMINGTKLLNVAGMTRGRRDGILKSEKIRHVVKIGPMHLKGVWIPFERALDFANREKITDLLYPLFVHDIGALLYHPSNQNRNGGAAMAAVDRRRSDHQQPRYPPAGSQAPSSMAHHHSMSTPVTSQMSQPPHSMASHPSSGRPVLDRAHTFPTPPTSASSLIGMGSSGNYNEWGGAGVSNMHANQPLSIDTGLSNTRSVPTTPATTPPGTMQNMQQYQTSQAYDGSRQVYSSHSGHQSQYGSQPGMMRYGQPLHHGSYPKNEMAPPSRGGDAGPQADTKPPEGIDHVSHGNEDEHEHDHDAEYNRSSAPYASNRGSYGYSANSAPGALHSEHPHLSPEMTGSPSHQSGSGRGTPRTASTSQQQWATGYGTPQRSQQAPASNLYSVMSDPRGPSGNSVSAADGYHAPGSMQTGYGGQSYAANGTPGSNKRMREDDDEQDPAGKRRMRAVSGAPWAAATLTETQAVR